MGKQVSPCPLWVQNARYATYQRWLTSSAFPPTELAPTMLEALNSTTPIDAVLSPPNYARISESSPKSEILGSWIYQKPRVSSGSYKETLKARLAEESLIANTGVAPLRRLYKYLGAYKVPRGQLDGSSLRFVCNTLVIRQSAMANSRHLRR